jgi:hypothetical protein
VVIPTGFAGSVPDKATGISPDPQKTTIPHNPSSSTQLASHEHAPPRSWVNLVISL